MTWVERNLDHIEKLRAYISGFQNTRPSLFNWFQGGREPLFPYTPESDRGTALLLCFCALYQKISEEKLIRVLGVLWQDYDVDLFRLGKLPYADLQNKIFQIPELNEWGLRSKAPGILRSTSDFFFTHGRLVPWVQKLADGEEAVRVLCEEVFMMGKTSAFKSKPRYFLYLLTQLPGVNPALFWTKHTLLTITPGHLRFIREFGPLKNRKRSPWVTAEEKLSYGNRFFSMLSPTEPWAVYAALDAYLKPKDKEKILWQCRDTLGGCLQCSLAALCPGREVE